MSDERTPTGVRLYQSLEDLAIDFDKAFPGARFEDQETKEYTGPDGKQYIQIHGFGRDAEGNQVPFIGSFPKPERVREDDGTATATPEAPPSEVIDLPDEVDTPVAGAAPESEVVDLPDEVEQLPAAGEGESEVIDLPDETEPPASVLNVGKRAPNARRLARGEPEVAAPPLDTRGWSQPSRTVGESLERSGRFMAGGLIDALKFPSELVAPIGKAVGLEGMDRGNKAIDKVIEGITGKERKDYEVDENALHFGGQLVPTPAKAAATAIGRIPELVTPFLPTQGLTLQQLLGNVALPTGVTTIIDRMLGKDGGTPSEQPAPAPAPQSATPPKSETITEWLQSHPETAGAIAIGGALGGRGRYLKSLGIKGVEKMDHTGPLDALERMAVDKFAPLKNILPDSVVARIESTIPASAMASRITHAQRFGLMPNSDVVLPTIPAGMYKAWAMMQPPQREATNKALRMLDDLDGRALGHGSQFGTMTDAQLQAEVAAARADPVVARWMDKHAGIMRGLLEYMNKRGLITNDEFLRLGAEQPNYISHLTAYTKPKSKRLAMKGLFEKVLGDKQLDNGLNTIEQIMQRSGTPRQWDEMVDAATGMENTISNVIRLAETNRVRASALLNLQRTRMDNGEMFAKRVGGPDEGNISILNHGKRVWYRVDDEGIAKMLQFTPQLAHTVANEVRRVFQLATTGVVGEAVNMAATGFLTGIPLPMQSIVNAYYESQGILAQAYKGSKFAPWDMILALPRGVMDTAKARINASIARSTEAAAILGTKPNNPATAQAIRNAADASARTITGIMEREGGMLTGFTSPREFETMRSLAANYAPEFQRLTSPSMVPAFVRAGYNAATHLYDATQLAWKLQYIAKNLKPGMTAAEERAVVNQAARVTGDFRQTGDESGVIGFARSVTPYGNVALQSMYATMRAGRENPQRLLTTLIGLGLAELSFTLYQMKDHPQLAAFYWGQMTPEQRAYGAPVWLDPTKPQQLGMVQQPQEFRPFMVFMREMLGEQLGLKDGTFWSKHDGKFAEAVMNLLGHPVSKEGITELKAGMQGSASQLLGDLPIGGGVPGAALGLAGLQFSWDRGLVPVQTSKQAVEPGYEYINDPAKRMVLDVLRETLGATGSAIVNAWRGMDQVARTEGLDTMDAAQHALRRGAEHMAQPYAERAQRLTGMFGIDQKISSMSTTARHLQPKETKIDTLSKIVAEIATGGDKTSATPKTALQLAAPHQPDFSPQAANVATLLSKTSFMKSWSEASTARAQVYEARDKLVNHPSMPVSDKAKMNSQYNQQITMHNARMLQIAEDMEAFVSQKTGRPFRFDDLQLTR